MYIYILNLSKHLYECSQGKFKIIPLIQTNYIYTWLYITSNKRRRFIDKFKPTLNKTRSITHIQLETNIHIYVDAYKNTKIIRKKL